MSKKTVEQVYEEKKHEDAFLKEITQRIDNYKKNDLLDDDQIMMCLTAIISASLYSRGTNCVSHNLGEFIFHLSAMLEFYDEEREKENSDLN